MKTPKRNYHSITKKIVAFHFIKEYDMLVLHPFIPSLFLADFTSNLLPRENLTDFAFESSLVSCFFNGLMRLDIKDMCLC